MKLIIVILSLILTCCGLSNTKNIEDTRATSYNHDLDHLYSSLTVYIL